MYKSLNEIRQDCLNCKKCGLSKYRTNVVFGNGNPNAPAILIGEGPGEKEDLSGEPFVGRAGKLLDQYINAVGLDRQQDIFIANIVKCRPPNNRDPLQEEQDACIEWLREQVRVIRPKLIVCLGRVAACRLISADFKVTKQHGQLFEKNGIMMMGTFHPAALLRNPNYKEAALQDFMNIKSFLFAK